MFKKALKEQEEIQSQDALSLEELVETEVRALVVASGGWDSDVNACDYQCLGSVTM